VELEKQEQLIEEQIGQDQLISIAQFQHGPNKGLLRVIAAVLIVAFLGTDIAWAQRPTFSLPKADAIEALQQTLTEEEIQYLKDHPEKLQEILDYQKQISQRYQEPSVFKKIMDFLLPSAEAATDDNYKPWWWTKDDEDTMPAMRVLGADDVLALPQEQAMPIASRATSLPVPTALPTYTHRQAAEIPTGRVELSIGEDVELSLDTDELSNATNLVDVPIPEVSELQSQVEQESSIEEPEQVTSPGGVNVQSEDIAETPNEIPLAVPEATEDITPAAAVQEAEAIIQVEEVQPVTTESRIDKIEDVQIEDNSPVYQQADIDLNQSNFDTQDFPYAVNRAEEDPKPVGIDRIRLDNTGPPSDQSANATFPQWKSALSVSNQRINSNQKEIQGWRSVVYTTEVADTELDNVQTEDNSAEQNGIETTISTRAPPQTESVTTQNSSNYLYGLQLYPDYTPAENPLSDPVLAALVQYLANLPYEMTLDDAMGVIPGAGSDCLDRAITFMEEAQKLGYDAGIVILSKDNQYHALAWIDLNSDGNVQVNETIDLTNPNATFGNFNYVAEGWKQEQVVKSISQLQAYLDILSPNVNIAGQVYLARSLTDSVNSGSATFAPDAYTDGIGLDFILLDPWASPLSSAAILDAFDKATKQGEDILNTYLDNLKIVAFMFLDGYLYIVDFNHIKREQKKDLLLALKSNAALPDFVSTEGSRFELTGATISWTRNMGDGTYTATEKYTIAGKPGQTGFTLAMQGSMNNAIGWSYKTQSYTENTTGGMDVRFQVTGYSLADEFEQVTYSVMWQFLNQVALMRGADATSYIDVAAKLGLDITKLEQVLNDTEMTDEEKRRYIVDEWVTTFDGQKLFDVINYIVLVGVNQVNLTFFSAVPFVFVPWVTGDNKITPYEVYSLLGDYFPNEIGRSQFGAGEEYFYARTAVLYQLFGWDRVMQEFPLFQYIYNLPEIIKQAKLDINPDFLTIEASLKTLGFGEIQNLAEAVIGSSVDYGSIAEELDPDLSGELYQQMLSEIELANNEGRDPNFAVIAGTYGVQESYLDQIYANAHNGTTSNNNVQAISLGQAESVVWRAMTQIGMVTIAHGEYTYDVMENVIDRHEISNVGWYEVGAHGNYFVPFEISIQTSSDFVYIDADDEGFADDLSSVNSSERTIRRYEVGSVSEYSYSGQTNTYTVYTTPQEMRNNGIHGSTSSTTESSDRYGWWTRYSSETIATQVLWSDVTTATHRDLSYYADPEGEFYGRLSAVQDDVVTTGWDVGPYVDYLKNIGLVQGTDYALEENPPEMYTDASSHTRVTRTDIRYDTTVDVDGDEVISASVYGEPSSYWVKTETFNADGTQVPAVTWEHVEIAYGMVDSNGNDPGGDKTIVVIAEQHQIYEETLDPDDPSKLYDNKCDQEHWKTSIITRPILDDRGNQIGEFKEITVHEPNSTVTYTLFNHWANGDMAIATGNYQDIFPLVYHNGTGYVASNFTQYAGQVVYGGSGYWPNPEYNGVRSAEVVAEIYGTNSYIAFYNGQYYIVNRDTGVVNRVNEEGTKKLKESTPKVCSDVEWDKWTTNASGSISLQELFPLINYDGTIYASDSFLTGIRGATTASLPSGATQVAQSVDGSRILYQVGEGNDAVFYLVENGQTYLVTAAGTNTLKQCLGYNKRAGFIPDKDATDEEKKNLQEQEDKTTFTMPPYGVGDYQWKNIVQFAQENYEAYPELLEDYSPWATERTYYEKTYYKAKYGVYYSITEQWGPIDTMVGRAAQEGYATTYEKGLLSVLGYPLEKKSWTFKNFGKNQVPEEPDFNFGMTVENGQMTRAYGIDWIDKDSDSPVDQLNHLIVIGFNYDEYGRLDGQTTYEHYRVYHNGGHTTVIYRSTSDNTFDSIGNVLSVLVDTYTWNNFYKHKSGFLGIGGYTINAGGEKREIREYDRYNALASDNIASERKWKDVDTDWLGTILQAIISVVIVVFTGGIGGILLGALYSALNTYCMTGSFTAAFTSFVIGAVLGIAGSGSAINKIFDTLKGVSESLANTVKAVLETIHQGLEFINNIFEKLLGAIGLGDLISSIGSTGGLEELRSTIEGNLAKQAAVEGVKFVTPSIFEAIVTNVNFQAALVIQVVRDCLEAGFQELMMESMDDDEQNFWQMMSWFTLAIFDAFVAPMLRQGVGEEKNMATGRDVVIPDPVEGMISVVAEFCEYWFRSWLQEMMMPTKEVKVDRNGDGKFGVGSTEEQQAYEWMSFGMYFMLSLSYSIILENISVALAISRWGGIVPNFSEQKEWEMRALQEGDEANTPNGGKRVIIMGGEVQYLCDGGEWKTIDELAKENPGAPINLSGRKNQIVPVQINGFIVLLNGQYYFVEIPDGKAVGEVSFSLSDMVRLPDGIRVSDQGDTLVIESFYGQTWSEYKANPVNRGVANVDMATLKSFEVMGVPMKINDADELVVDVDRVAPLLVAGSYLADTTQITQITDNPQVSFMKFAFIIALVKSNAAKMLVPDGEATLAVIATSLSGVTVVRYEVDGQRTDGVQEFSWKAWSDLLKNLKENEMEGYENVLTPSHTSSLLAQVEFLNINGVKQVLPLLLQEGATIYVRIGDRLVLVNDDNRSILNQAGIEGVYVDSAHRDFAFYSLITISQAELDRVGGCVLTGSIRIENNRVWVSPELQHGQSQLIVAADGSNYEVALVEGKFVIKNNAGKAVAALPTGMTVSGFGNARELGSQDAALVFIANQLVAASEKTRCFVRLDSGEMVEIIGVGRDGEKITITYRDSENNVKTVTKEEFYDLWKEKIIFSVKEVQAEATRAPSQGGAEDTATSTGDGGGSMVPTPISYTDSHANATPNEIMRRYGLNERYAVALSNLLRIMGIDINSAALVEHLLITLYLLPALAELIGPEIMDEVSLPELIQAVEAIIAKELEQQGDPEDTNTDTATRVYLASAATDTTETRSATGDTTTSTQGTERNSEGVTSERETTRVANQQVTPGYLLTDIYDPACWDFTHSLPDATTTSGKVNRIIAEELSAYLGQEAFLNYVSNPGDENVFDLPLNDLAMIASATGFDFLSLLQDVVLLRAPPQLLETIEARIKAELGVDVDISAVRIEYNGKIYVLVDEDKIGSLTEIVVHEALAIQGLPYEINRAVSKAISAILATGDVSLGRSIGRLLEGIVSPTSSSAIVQRLDLTLVKSILLSILALLSHKGTVDLDALNREFTNLLIVLGLAPEVNESADTGSSRAVATDDTEALSRDASQGAIENPQAALQFDSTTHNLTAAESNNDIASLASQNNRTLMVATEENLLGRDRALEALEAVVGVPVSFYTANDASLFGNDVAFVVLQYGNRVDVVFNPAVVAVEEISPLEVAAYELMAITAIALDYGTIDSSIADIIINTAKVVVGMTKSGIDTSVIADLVTRLTSAVVAVLKDGVANITADFIAIRNIVEGIIASLSDVELRQDATRVVASIAALIAEISQPAVNRTASVNNTSASQGVAETQTTYEILPPTPQGLTPVENREVTPLAFPENSTLMTATDENLLGNDRTLETPEAVVGMSVNFYTVDDASLFADNAPFAVFVYNDRIDVVLNPAVMEGSVDVPSLAQLTPIQIATFGIMMLVGFAVQENAITPEIADAIVAIADAALSFNNEEPVAAAIISQLGEILATVLRGVDVAEKVTQELRDIKVKLESIQVRLPEGSVVQQRTIAAISSIAQFEQSVEQRETGNAAVEAVADSSIFAADYLSVGNVGYNPIASALPVTDTRAVAVPVTLESVSNYQHIQTYDFIKSNATLDLVMLTGLLLTTGTFVLPLLDALVVFTTGPPVVPAVQESVVSRGITTVSSGASVSDFNNATVTERNTNDVAFTSATIQPELTEPDAAIATTVVPLLPVRGENFSLQKDIQNFANTLLQHLTSGSLDSSFLRSLPEVKMPLLMAALGAAAFFVGQLLNLLADRMVDGVNGLADTAMPVFATGVRNGAVPVTGRVTTSQDGSAQPVAIEDRNTSINNNTLVDNAAEDAARIDLLAQLDAYRGQGPPVRDIVAFALSQMQSLLNYLIQILRNSQTEQIDARSTRRYADPSSIIQVIQNLNPEALMALYMIPDILDLFLGQLDASSGVRVPMQQPNRAAGVDNGNLQVASNLAEVTEEMNIQGTGMENTGHNPMSASLLDTPLSRGPPAGEFVYSFLTSLSQLIQALSFNSKTNSDTIQDSSTDNLLGLGESDQTVVPTVVTNLSADPTTEVTPDGFRGPNKMNA
jgi:hypothetical protein